MEDGSEQLPIRIDKNPWDEPTEDGLSPAQKVAEISPKRLWEQEQQELVDRDYAAIYEASCYTKEMMLVNARISLPHVHDVRKLMPDYEDTIVYRLRLVLNALDCGMDGMNRRPTAWNNVANAVVMLEEVVDRINEVGAPLVDAIDTGGSLFSPD